MMQNLLTPQTCNTGAARMKKLTLDVEELSVESFPTAAPQADRGTVEAHVITPKCVVTGGVDSCWCTERSCP
jgi:hypothetical protein